MVNYEALKARVQELSEREWGLPAMEARYKKLALEGIPKKNLNRNEIIARKQEILEKAVETGAYIILGHGHPEPLIAVGLDSDGRFSATVQPV